MMVISAPMKIWILTFLALAFALASLPARTFTSLDGRTVDATIVAVAGNKVRIERIADGTQFDLEIASLTVDDQAYILQWMQGDQPLVPHPLGYQTVRLHFPTLLDFNNRPFVVGWQCFGRRVDGRTIEFELPPGAFVWLYFLRRSGTYSETRFILPFEGKETDYYLDWQDGILTQRTSPQGPARARGITFTGDPTVDEAAIERLHQLRPYPSLAVSGRVTEATPLDDLGGEVESLYLTRLERTELPTSLRAFYLVDPLPGVSILEGLPNLEVFRMTQFGEMVADEGFAGALLTAAPTLNTLSINGNMTPGFVQRVGTHPALRHLVLWGTLLDDTDSFSPLDLNGAVNLESLRTEWQVDPLDIAANPSLALLETSGTSLGTSARPADASPLPNLRNLKVTDDTDLGRLRRNDNSTFPFLRSVTLSREVDYTKFPSLERLILDMLDGASAYLRGLEPLAGQLREFSLQPTSQQNVNFIGEHCRDLSCLWLYNADVSDLSALRKLP